MNGDGKPRSIIGEADYRKEGGIYNILHASLFRWELTNALSIGDFLELIGRTGSTRSGYRIAPKHRGFLGLWSKGYNCVTFCELFLNYAGLSSTRTGWFLGREREDVIKHILSSEHDEEKIRIIAHDQSEFITIGDKTKYTLFMLKSLTDAKARHLSLGQDSAVFLNKDF